jgi:hypothetical protein
MQHVLTREWGPCLGWASGLALLYLVILIKYSWSIPCVLEDCKSELEAIKKQNWTKLKTEENMFILPRMVPVVGLQDTGQPELIECFWRERKREKEGGKGKGEGTETREGAGRKKVREREQNGSGRMDDDRDRGRDNKM